MLEPKHDIFDRISQSVSFMKIHFIKLVLPLFIYNFLFFWVIYLFFINYVSWIIWGLSDFSWESFLSILYSVEGVLIIAIMMFLLLLNALLYIPFLLASIKSIDQAAMWEEIKMKENIIYGFINILNSFRTYWYIFKYIYLLPAWIFIVWGILFNLLHILEITWTLWDLLDKVSMILMSLSFVLFLVFSIYRGLKASFVLYSAVSNEKFTQEDFNKSIKTTNNQLWRILWNFLLIWFIVSSISKLIGSIVGLFLPDSIKINWLDDLLSSDQISSAMAWGKMPTNFDMSQLDVTFSSINHIIASFANQFIATIFIVFWFVFTYIFMKRLVLESNNHLNLEIINETKNNEKFIEKVDNQIEL